MAGKFDKYECKKRTPDKDSLEFDSVFNRPVIYLFMWFLCIFSQVSK